MSQEEKAKDAILKGARVSVRGFFRCPGPEGYLDCLTCIFYLNKKNKRENNCELIENKLLNDTPNLLNKTFAKYPLLMFCYKEARYGE